MQAATWTATYWMGPDTANEGTASKGKPGGESGLAPTFSMGEVQRRGWPGCTRGEVMAEEDQDLVYALLVGWLLGFLMGAGVAVLLTWLPAWLPVSAT